MATARQKYKALIKAYFLPFEAIEFVRTSRITDRGKIKITPVPLTLPYVKQMIRDRAKVGRIAQKEGTSYQDFIDSINDFYTENGYLDRKGLPDFWQWFRDIRDKATDRGEYIPPIKKRTKLLDKGDIKAQKARYRARKAEQKAFQERIREETGKEVAFNPATGKYEVRRIQ